jgi:hypothetical protein
MIRDGALEPSDFWARLIANQMFVASEAAHRVDQHHRVIARSAKLEAGLMSGAFGSAGPFSVGPGFAHPLQRPRSGGREGLWQERNRGECFKYWMYSLGYSIAIHRINIVTSNLRLRK